MNIIHELSEFNYTSELYLIFGIIFNWILDLYLIEFSNNMITVYNKLFTVNCLLFASKSRIRRQRNKVSRFKYTPLNVIDTKRMKFSSTLCIDE